MSSVVCANCGRLNRSGAKVCAGCGKPLAIQTPPSPPPQQPVTPKQPPAPSPLATPPQQPVTPRQPPGPPPPRKPPTPQPQPARQQPTAGSKFKLTMKPWQYVAMGGVVVLLCLCVLLVNAVAGIFRPSTPTLTFAPLPSYTVAPQITVLVYSPTPAPVTFAPVPTRVPPTFTPVPTQVPKPTSSATTTPLPTATPTVTPTPAQTPTDTPSNTVLDVNKKWRQQSLEMLVQNARFSNVTCESLFEFDLSLENTEPGELVISWKGDEITVADNTGKMYDVFYQPAPRDPADCTKNKPIKEMSKTALAGKENYKIGIAVRGTLPDSIKDFTVTIGRVGTRIQNAKWKIVVHR